MLSDEKQDTVFESLFENYYTVSNIDELLGHEVQGNGDWVIFKDTWNHLDQDKYMNDNGDYRLRKFTKAKYCHNDDTLWMKEYDYYYQPPKVNALNGGMKRWFTQIDIDTFNNKILNAAIKTIGRSISEFADQKEWNINIYLNRILAKNCKEGKPSPEGIHKDGVKFSLLLLMDRENVNGGENTIYDLNKKPTFTHTLKSEGECILFMDEPTYHFASPVTQVDISTEGHRDLLVIEFY